MLFYSTNLRSPKVDFKEATIKGQAPDGGLYFPENIPRFSEKFLNELKGKSKADIAFEVIRPYVGDSIGEDALYEICAHTVSFDFPLVKVTESIYSLELFHGPTLAFKDVGARFMSRCLGYFSKGSDKKVTVLVATSGDTGSAVANGFLGVEGVEVVILYPSGKVSQIQELQLTTLGQNITALEIKGTFDDCQKMVKEAFRDAELNGKLFLTSANSINVARWLPQQFYYLFALQQWQFEEPPVISVPSGNFGNICAGLLAWKSGMPVKHFIAACNANDVFVHYLRTGELAVKQARPTYSNAMDVGNPSNLVRLQALFENNVEEVRKEMSGCEISDGEVKEVIGRVFKDSNYMLDPHGAVGYLALERYLNMYKGERGLFLETAHAVKFGEVVKSATGKEVEVPESMKYLLGLKKKSVGVEPEYLLLKQYLLNK